MKVFDFHWHLHIRDGDMDKHFVSMLKLMDELEIEQAVVHAAPAGQFGFLGTLCGGNQEVFEAVKKYPDRLLGSVYIDPREEHPVKVLTEYHSRGAVCVKFLPFVGYYPDEEICFPVYEQIEKLGLPLLVHVGLTNIPYIDGSGRITESKYCMPIHVDGPARKFPGITFVLAHLGWPYFQEAFALAKFNKNIYLDISGPFAVEEGLNLHSREGFGFMPPETPDLWEKIIWGSDGIELAWSLKTVKDYLIQIGRKDLLDQFFYSTSRKILKLEK